MKRLASYSQYFLRSPALIKELIGHSSIKKTDTVYDIGAGSGAITSVLAQRAARVVAIEHESRMIQKLRQNMRRYENVTVIEADFLTMQLPGEPYKVFANIPFHISAAIVRKLVFTSSPPVATYIIVQKQFAHKLLIDSSPFTGLLGAHIAPWVTVKIRRPLRRTDYWPHPNVDTVLIEIKPRPHPLLPSRQQEVYGAWLQRCYDQAKYFQSLPLATITNDGSIRPSQVSLAQWLLLFEKVDVLKVKQIAKK